MLKIGDFSKLSRISIRMLRHYNDLGLLIPDSTDPCTGYRYYSETQLPVAGRINMLKDMGFSLTMIKEIMLQYSNPQALKNYLLLKRTDLLEQKEKLKTQITLLDNALNRLGKDDYSMEYNVTLKTLPERYVASVRDIIPSYDCEGKLWQIMMKETAPLKMQDGEPCYTFGIYHDTGYKEHDVDVEIQKCVKGHYENTEHVIFKTVPPVQIASATYTGGYDKIEEANEAVARWVKDNGYDFDGLSFSIYHVSPHETQNPDELVTEVCYPVRKK